MLYGTVKLYVTIGVDSAVTTARVSATQTHGASHMWEYKVGDIVIWPNGVEGRLCGIDEDGQLLDECGGWNEASETDPVRRG